MTTRQRYGPPFQAGIFTVTPTIRRGKGLDNRAAKPMDTILLDGKLREALEDEAQKIAAQTNRAYAFYRSITWYFRRQDYLGLLSRLGNFKTTNWRIAQAYVVSSQPDVLRKSNKRIGQKREEGTVYIERDYNLARNAMIRVTRIRLER